MDVNPYESPKLPEKAKYRLTAGPSGKYALLGFPIAWLIFPLLWLALVVRHGETATGILPLDVGYVLSASVCVGTPIGAVLSAVLFGILRLVRWWNESRLEPPP